MLLEAPRAAANRKIARAYLPSPLASCASMVLVDATSATIAPYLKVLASESRLSLLSALRTPKTIDELLIPPSPSRGVDRTHGPISRQAVQRHLDVLLDAGLVKREPSHRGVGRASYAYVLDHTRVFAIVEEIRALTAYESTMSSDLVRTQSGPSSPRNSWEAGPKLVLVHGVGEGRAFALRESERREGHGWIVGRSADAQVPIVHDPFVSAQNAEISHGPGGYTVTDLRASRNGTCLNWERLGSGETAPLRVGDVLTVGRSLLLFRLD